MRIASLYFAGQEWLWPASAVSAVALLLVAWSYARTPAPAGLRLACAGLKLLGVAALVACLLEPMWTGERAKPGANLFAVVADNSQSMTLRGRGEAETRGEALRSVLTSEKGRWRANLAETFSVKNYLADSRLQPTQEFGELSFEGRSSSLGRALQLLNERSRGQPLAGVLLLTDGVAADLADGANMQGLPPVYPIVFGQEQPAKDLAVTATSVSQTSFEDAPVTLQADVLATGSAGEEIVGRLFPVDPGAKDAPAKPVAEQTVRVPQGEEKVVFRFQMRPEKTGVLFYRLQIGTKGSDGAGEATLANNETVVAVDRGHGPYRVLYVSGRPNWEFKFLRRALEADDQTHLVALIRIARREPKFEFRGRTGESSNPLFRGFGNQSKEEIERYDQPVLVRLNTEDQVELRAGFPKTPEELFRYHAVILDDLEAEFFPADQMSLLQRFVSERGGGFLMLGGAESFAEGKFQRSAIGDMLPVYLEGKPPLPAKAQLRLVLTREGWLQPWARMRNNEPQEKARLEAMPHFDVLNQAGGPKPAAMVAASVTDGRTEYPAIVTQRFGRGRTAALLVGDWWQGGLADDIRSQDLAKGWRQMIRWLVADVPDAVESRVEPRSDGEGVRIQVRARDPKFLPLDNATVTIQVHQAGAAESATATIPAEASTQEPGLYEATYLPRESGGYRVDAAVVNENGAQAGTAQTGWSSDLAAAEFQSLTPNRGLMESLARQTGGRLVPVEELERFVGELPSLRVPVKETWMRPIWHTPVMFLFALACLVSEWGLRRWKGLA